MVAKWQKWMPFHIDRFRGSPDVQAMHPSARLGYIYLLASMWQTEDCTLPNDQEELASLSSLNDKLWAKYGDRILRKFTLYGDRNGHRNGDRTDSEREFITNDVLFHEWSEAKRIFEARSNAAKKTTETRSPRKKTDDKADESRSPLRSPLRSADTQTQTRTETETVVQEQLQERERPPTPAVTARASAERLREKVENQNRLNPFSEDISLLVRQIVCAYPKSRLRSLVADEVRPSEEQAVVVALIAEQARQGGTERGIAGYLLDRAQAFASKVPEDQWRYLPKVQDFFSGLEYRREPEDMIHARNGGNGNGKRSGSSGKGTDGNADALREFLASKGIVRPDADHGDQRLADEPGRGSQPQDELDSAVELRGQPRGPDAGGHHPRVHEGTGRGELLAHPVTPKRAMWP